MKTTFRTILVIGDNHEEIAKKYSNDTKVEKYVKMRLSEADDERLEHMNLIELILTDKRLHFTENVRERYKEEYLHLKGLNALDYFKEMTVGCEFDNEDCAWTDKNPNAHYQYELCHQHRLEVTGEEGDFSDPFPLKNGEKSYSAHFNEIDWDKLHNNKDKINMCKRVWELAVEDAEPEDEYEEELKEIMGHREKYFQLFNSRDEFVKHSSSLWYWGVATEEKYVEVDYTISDYDWVVNFFDTFIKPLAKTNPLITVYQVKALD